MLTFIRQLFQNKQASEWQTFKASDNLYPAGPIAIITMQSSTGGLLTGWINKGYKDYPYKKFCRNNFLIKVDLGDKAATSTPHMDTVEKYFLDNLRNACVSHLVARLATDNGLNLEFYLENRDAGMITLLHLSNDPNKLVNFTYENNYDPSWEAVTGLFNA